MLPVERSAEVARLLAGLADDSIAAWSHRGETGWRLAA